MNIDTTTLNNKDITQCFFSVILKIIFKTELMPIKIKKTNKIIISSIFSNPPLFTNFATTQSHEKFVIEKESSEFSAF